MPSPPFKLNAANPQGVISLPFTANWVYIDNATGSPLFVRLGGTDYPTIASCDLRVPAGGTVVMPTRAKDFAAIFASSILAGGIGSQGAATIIFGMYGEPAPAFGSISPGDPVQWTASIPPLTQPKTPGVRHVVTAIVATIFQQTTASRARMQIQLFDGDDDGVLNPILTVPMQVPGIGVPDRFVSPSLKIIGSSGHSMTLDYGAAALPADVAALFWSGYDTPG